jgi:uncharacterized protein YukE
MAGYNTLDTRAFDNFIYEKSSLISTYNGLCEEYNSIVSTLYDAWKGRGAEAFESDTQKVKTNLIGVQDILKTVCDILIDCRAVFGECDTSLGSLNRDAYKIK